MTTPRPVQVNDLDWNGGEEPGLSGKRATFRSILESLPGETGVELAWIGELEPSGHVALGHAVRARTDVFDGLVVPPGAGLGGQVIQTGRPAWVPDYVAATEFTTPFRAQADREGIRGMVAVPLEHAGRRLGVLYGGHRCETSYGDVTVRSMEVAATRAADAAVTAERTQRSAEVAVYEERRRMALHLHDTVGAVLFAVGAGVRSLGDDLAHDPELSARLAAIERQTAEAAGMFRAALTALHAPPASCVLPVSLQADCRGFEERTGIEARLLVLDEMPPLHASRSRALLAFVREALLNVEKHAQANAVLVNVFRANGGVTVAVHDDGIGLRAGWRDQAGLGFAATTDRLGRLGGQLRVTSNEDGGVTVRAWIPC